jgi:hypothetical protein
MSDYEQLYQALKLPICSKESRPGEIRELEKITIADCFCLKTKEDLAISHAHLVNTI